MGIVASGQITLIDLNDAKSLNAYIQANQAKAQLYNPNTGALTPDWTVAPNLVLTPELYISGSANNIIAQAKSITWYEAGSTTPIATGANGYTIGASNPKALTISQNKLTAAAPQKSYVCEIVYYDTPTQSDVKVKAEIDFVRVDTGVRGNDGYNAIIGVLSNESHSLPADQNGNVTSWTNAESTMTIYNGSTDDSANWTVAATATSNITGSLTGKKYTVTAMTGDVGTVTFTASRAASGGRTYSNVVKTFTLTKNKQGVAGTTPSSYWMTLPKVVQKNVSNVLNPSSIVITAYTQTGTGAPTTYAGRFKIFESTDGVNYPTTPNYTSAANEATKTYPIASANSKSIKVQYFLNNGTTLVDEEVIMVVSDGATGAAAVVNVTYTPDGNIIKNGVGSLRATSDVYVGGTKTTSGVTWQWQRLVSGSWVTLNATTNYGTTGYTTSTLTIPAGAIEGLSTYKAIATYGGKAYEDFVTVVDQTDLIQAVLIAAEGNIYKNGEGTKNITCKLYRVDGEQDPDGTIYDYKWYMRNAAGVIDANFGGTGINFKTGKTITVPASQITNLGNLVVEVLTK